MVNHPISGGRPREEISGNYAVCRILKSVFPDGEGFWNNRDLRLFLDVSEVPRYLKVFQDSNAFGWGNMRAAEKLLTGPAAVKVRFLPYLMWHSIDKYFKTPKCVLEMPLD